jgi:hypothetical protein
MRNGNQLTTTEITDMLELFHREFKANIKKAKKKVELEQDC